jgi:hypothetical protein
MTTARVPVMNARKKKGTHKSNASMDGRIERMQILRRKILTTKKIRKK